MNSQNTVLWIPGDQGVIEKHFLNHANLFSHSGITLEVVSGENNDLRALDRLERGLPIDAMALPQYLPLSTEFSRRMEDKGFMINDSFHFGEVVARLIRTTEERNPFPAVPNNCPILLIGGDPEQGKGINGITLADYFDKKFPLQVRNWVENIVKGV